MLRGVEDSQGNFQIKAGHVRVLELRVSHKQLSYCGKSNKLNSDFLHIRVALFLFLGHAGFEVSFRCDDFYERGDMAQWRHTTIVHSHTDTHLQPDWWISLI